MKNIITEQIYTQETNLIDSGNDERSQICECLKASYPLFIDDPPAKHRHGFGSPAFLYNTADSCFDGALAFFACATMRRAR